MSTLDWLYLWNLNIRSNSNYVLSNELGTFEESQLSKNGAISPNYFLFNFFKIKISDTAIGDFASSDMARGVSNKLSLPKKPSLTVE